MRGFRFYLEHASPADKRKGLHEGNVFALCTDAPIFYSENALGKACQEGLGAVFYEPNSDVCWCSTSLERLRTHCKRISEMQARQVHPALFARLDAED